MIAPAVKAYGFVVLNERTAAFRDPDILNLIS